MAGLNLLPMCLSIKLLTGPMFGFTIRDRVSRVRRYPMCIGTLLVEAFLTRLLSLLRCFVSLRWNVRHRPRVRLHVVPSLLLEVNTLPHRRTMLVVLIREVVPMVLGLARQYAAGKGTLLGNIGWATMVSGSL